MGIDADMAVAKLRNEIIGEESNVEVPGGWRPADDLSDRERAIYHRARDEGYRAGWNSRTRNLIAWFEERERKRVRK